MLKKNKRLYAIFIAFIMIQSTIMMSFGAQETPVDGEERKPQPTTEMAAEQDGDGEALQEGAKQEEPVIAPLPVATQAERLGLLMEMGILKNSSNPKDQVILLRRIEGSILISRLMPAAFAGEIQPLPFSDVPQWAGEEIAKLYSKGIIKGSTQTQFGAGLMNAKSFVTMGLRVLGYSDVNGDFEYNHCLEFAKSIGMISEAHYNRLQSSLFYKRDALNLEICFLNTKLKGEDITLSQKLVEEGRLNEAFLSRMASAIPPDAEISGYHWASQVNAVNLGANYTYAEMLGDYNELKQAYPFMETGSIGKSVMGQDLPYMRLGIGDKKVFINASHHAREWITSAVVMEFADQYLSSFVANQTIGGQSSKTLWETTSLYIVPMVNPDGVDLSIYGVDPSYPRYAELMKMNKQKTNFSRWKANINGVDLNSNYDASWEAVRAKKAGQGIIGPAPEGFPGYAPVSEPETQAVVAFTNQMQFDIVLAYHSSGQILYWDYDGLITRSNYTLAKRLANVSGYGLRNQPNGSTATGAGYKDWFILAYGKPGFTIEVGSGTAPVPVSSFPSMYPKNERLIIEAIK